MTQSTNLRTSHDFFREFCEGENDEELKEVMESEVRFHDMFAEDARDQLPDLLKSPDQKLNALQQLNGESESRGQNGANRSVLDGEEYRPRNQLLKQRSQADFDPWMLKELEKSRGKNGKFEDLFNLACHPKMLELAFVSLKKRRPGSMPPNLESNFFELVRRM